MAVKFSSIISITIIDLFFIFVESILTIAISLVAGIILGVIAVHCK